MPKRSQSKHFRGGRLPEGAWKVTWTSLLGNLGMGGFKLLAGGLTKSYALIADGIHSLVDASTDAGVLLGLRFTAMPRDASHPYGHHRFSTLFQIGISIALLAFSGAIAWASIVEIRDPSLSSPESWAVGAAALSLVLKEVLFRWTRKIAWKGQSQLLMANAWHHRADSLSSLLVLVALGAITWGGPEWAFLDKLVGVVLGVMLFLVALRQLYSGFNDLTDRIPERKILDDFREHILSVEGALAYHDFRARRIGDVFEVDLHLQVNPGMSVQEGHEIAREVKRKILSLHPEVFDVLVHLEPADPERLKAVGLSDSTLDHGFRR